MHHLCVPCHGELDFGYPLYDSAGNQKLHRLQTGTVKPAALAPPAMLQSLQPESVVTDQQTACTWAAPGLLECATINESHMHLALAVRGEHQQCFWWLNGNAYHECNCVTLVLCDVARPT